MTETQTLFYLLGTMYHQIALMLQNFQPMLAQYYEVISQNCLFTLRALGWTI